MKRIVFGVVIAVCTFFAGVGLDRLFVAAYSQLWPTIPVVELAPDLTIYEVTFCELLERPGDFDSKMVKFNVQRRMVSGTILGLLGANACPGFIHAECPADGTCDLLPNLIGQVEFAKSDVVIVGKFRRSDLWGDHSIEIQTVVEQEPQLECWDGSRAHEYDQCPAIPSADISVGGINIDSKHSQVVRAFGKPVKKKIESVEGDAWSQMILEYPGMTVSLVSDQDGRNFSVNWIEVTSPKWNVTGLKIGDPAEAVTQKFGRPIVTEDGSGLSYSHVNNDGFVEFSIAHGRISAISIGIDGC